MPFLFSKTMAQRAFHFHEILEDKYLSSRRVDDGIYYMILDCRQKKDAVDVALKAYDFFCQQYLGLGFVASIIPGTEAFRARSLLSDEVDQLSNLLIAQLSVNTDSLENYHDMMSLQGPILGALLRLPLKMMINILGPYRSADHLVNYKVPVKELLFYLPILHDMYYAEVSREVRSNYLDYSFNKVAYLNDAKIANIVHTICNPVRLLEDFLSFLHKAINRILEIRSEWRQRSGVIRKTLKELVALVFSIINIPVKIVSAITDIPYQVLQELILPPVMSALTSYRNGAHQFNRKLSIKELASCFPVLHDLYADSYYDLIANLFHTLCNPMRLLNDSLSFLHKAINRIIEIGSEESEESGLIRKGLKEFLGVAFSIINIPVKIVSAITDLPYQVLKKVLFSSLDHIAALFNTEDQMIVKNDDVNSIDALAGKAISKHLTMRRQKMITSGAAAALGAASNGATTAKVTALISEYALADEDKEEELRASPENFFVHQYGRPALVSSEFSLYEVTASDKRMMSQLFNITHTKLSEEDQIEAARTVIMGSAPQLLR